jgi:transposase
MRTGRPKTPLVLSREEGETLDSLAHRSRTAPQLARRARIVLACADGLDNKVVAKKLRMTPQTVGRWRMRFVVDRLDGLYDEPRPGTPRKITDAQVEAVLIRTRRASPAGRPSGACARWRRPAV